MPKKSDGRITYNAGYPSYSALISAVAQQVPHQHPIAIITDYPSFTDLAQQAPLSDYEGAILKNWLYLNGISWLSCFVTSVIGDRMAKKPTQQDIDALISELHSVAPSAILMLGDIPLKAIYPSLIGSISYWRGSCLEAVYDSHSVKAVPIYHPRDAIREWGISPICTADVGKLKTHYKKQEFNEHYTNDAPAFMLNDIVGVLRRDGIKSYSHILIDIETQGEFITVVGLAIKETGLNSWNYYNFNTCDWGVTEIRLLGELLSTPALKIGHNLAFDFMLIWQNWGIMPVKPWFDTMLAWHAHNPELPKSLDVCSTMALETQNWKAESSGNIYWYNFLDLWHTVKLYEHIAEEVGEKSNIKKGFDLMVALVEPVIHMQLRGLKVNQRKLLELLCYYESKLSQINLPFNPNSTPQVLAYMNSIGVGGKVNRRTHKPTADEASIEAAIKKTGDFKLAQTLQHREIAKIISTYLTKALDKERMKTSYNISGTTSGRFSSSKGLFGGTNLQNWSKSLREIFIPDDGMVFLEADLSQAEARVVAWLSQDDKFINFFKDGKDIHQEVANFVGVPRQTAKKIVHAVHYGMGKRTCAAFVGCTVAEADKYIHKYLQLFPGVQRFQSIIKAKIQQDRTLTTPLGRKRIFYGRIDDQTFNEALSFIPQSVVSDINKLGLVKLYEEGFDILGENHDAVLMQVPITWFNLIPTENITYMHKVIYPLVTKLMTTPVIIYGKELVIPVSFQTGTNWKDMIEVKL